MDLSVNNDEIYRLALELAALTGESLASAVAVAIRERIEDPVLWLFSLSIFFPR